MTGSRFESVLLGFDAREIQPALDPHDEHARQFLLRTDVDCVLSADDMIWPSLFVSADLGSVGMNVPFWEDLAALRTSLPPVPSILIAATWHTDIGFEQEAKQPDKMFGPYLSEERQQPDPTWAFLGFDIADGGFISGLSNCGYDEDRDKLAAEWGGSLNRFHLFDDIGRAFQFRLLTNSRVPEHAPFFVIGLWSVPMI